MRKTLLAFFGMIVLVGSAAMAGGQVSSDFDRTYDYSGVRTFTIQIATSWGNPLAEKRVLSEIEQVLAGKGWVKADESKADVIVMVHGATQAKKSLTAMYSGGGWRFGGMGSGTIQERDYTVGTLLVDIFDAKTKALLYRGTAQGELSTSPDKNQKKVRKAAAKMFKDFPPAAGKSK